MKRMDWLLTSAVVAAIAAVGVGSWALAADRGLPAQEAPRVVVTEKGAEPAKVAVKEVAKVAAKPLTENVKRGLSWLAQHQNKDGGWGQGEESAAMGTSSAEIRDTSNVGDTCAAALALIRSGSTPSSGDFHEQIKAAALFVCEHVEKSDETSMKISTLEGIRLQTKLGPNIDTFLASLFLGEIRNQMPDDGSKKRVVAALDKVLNKIEKNQQKDGTFAGGGWAPALAQGIASKGANVAAANGATISEGTLQNFEKQSQGNTNASGGVVDMGGTAGVQLYGQAGNVTALANQQVRLEKKQEEIKGNIELAQKAKLGDKDAAEKLRAIAVDRPNALPAGTAKLAATSQPGAVAAYDAIIVGSGSDLKAIDQRVTLNSGKLAVAAEATTQAVKDDKFIAGFGSNGGEEFLSYVNLGEGLRVKGGKEWDDWNAKITANVENVQNKDGSWSGHHCITGRTFCTSAALMVLTIEQAPVQLGDKIRKQ